jgi:hypothetical protein
VGYNREKSYNAEWYFDLKCLSLPPDETLGKIGYLKIQINSWRVLQKCKYMVNFILKNSSACTI